MIATCPYPEGHVQPAVPVYLPAVRMRHARWHEGALPQGAGRSLPWMRTASEEGRLGDVPGRRLHGDRDSRGQASGAANGGDLEVSEARARDCEVSERQGSKGSQEAREAHRASISAQGVSSFVLPYRLRPTTRLGQSWAAWDTREIVRIEPTEESLLLREGVGVGVRLRRG